MNTEEFNYHLPENLIAQTPLKNRAGSKLLLMNKDNGTLDECLFENIINQFKEGDVLVLNNTKVLPARLIGLKEETGATIELLLLKNIENNKWECLAKPQKRLKEGTVVKFSDKLSASVISKGEDGIVIIEFLYNGIFNEILEELGSMPLPPYIKERLDDKDRYQTVYAKELGSAAAPTAGLHFTEELLNKLKLKGVQILYVTLHVGLGTFRPVEVSNVLEHNMHSEKIHMSNSVAEALNEAKKDNKKIYSVGTTTARTLESIITKYDKFIECTEETDIFIYPGYTFKAIDGLITNFHLPKSTLLMLVSALSKKEYILSAYNYAVENEYRFFSFGDAMFIK